MKRTAIITGASRGIGKACALELAQHFDCVVINSCHHSTDLEQVKQAIEALNCQCLAFTGDVGDYTFTASMMGQVLEQCPNVELLVNNAGISYVGLLTDMHPADWNQIIQTNLSSLFNCSQPLIPDMVHRQSGHIINISSMWGISGASCEVAYSAAKGGVNAFTRALGKELAPSHVRVNAIACGAIDTQMNACFDKTELQALCDEIPSCRLGRPEEIAKLVYQLYESPMYLTGEVIKIDGGYL
ncbi:MAG: SDR family NAD(P)-dependent oxidoreductase [Lachnospiraceae bacterium]|nr:SDR family NAD(P)-dependent oxidoreductase [Lachnospiraceae bacterium]HCJ08650.1 3-oxoacyl-ACP reductase [Lachnospiraceae bacterium]